MTDLGRRSGQPRKLNGRKQSEAALLRQGPVMVMFDPVARYSKFTVKLPVEFSVTRISASLAAKTPIDCAPDHHRAIASIARSLQSAVLAACFHCVAV